MKCFKVLVSVEQSICMYLKFVLDMICKISSDNTKEEKELAGDLAELYPCNSGITRFLST